MAQQPDKSPSAKPHDRTPILVGVGQVVRHWDGASPDDAPSPQGLQATAARRAMDDAGASDALTEAIDTVHVIRSNLDSIPGAAQPFGRCANPPATLAERLGVTGARHIYSVVGGDQPQTLVNEVAEAIFAGETRAAIIAGSEALATLKLALKKNIDLDWSASAEGAMKDRGLGPPLLTSYELANGLGAPTQTYPAFEHALRTRLGLDRDEHIAVMSQLWEGFSRVAAANPYAQFPVARSAEFLARESRENYPIADPYLKWHVAQDAVNQGAALVLTSVGEAQALGIDPGKWIYLHGYASARDKPVTERSDLSRSVAMELALELALDAAGKDASQMAFHDLYSCFPCAVLLAAEALDLDWREATPTVTGGLPFFGGPGNGYSLHAIASMAEALRSAPDTFGLVLANGGFLSKEAVGVYSALPAENWQPVSSAEIQSRIDALPSPDLLSKSCEAEIETFTVTYRKGEPARGYVIARTAEGRILARARSGDGEVLERLAADDPVGHAISIESEDGVNYIR